MKKLLLAAFLLISAPVYANTITINEINQGGMLDDFVAFWKWIAASGDNIVIDAPCSSGCTLFLAYVPTNKVCITNKGSLGIHKAANDSGPIDEFSKALYRSSYPEWVLKWIQSKGGITKDVIFMWPEDMKGHINLCPGSAYSGVPADDIIHHDSVAPVGGSETITTP